MVNIKNNISNRWHGQYSILKQHFQPLVWSILHFKTIFPTAGMVNIPFLVADITQYLRQYYTFLVADITHFQPRVWSILKTTFPTAGMVNIRFLVADITHFQPLVWSIFHFIVGTLLAGQYTTLFSSNSQFNTQSWSIYKTNADITQYLRQYYTFPTAAMVNITF